jgi:predicted nuclease with RNAse H fold
VLTLGVDLAAADDRTATAVVEWSDRRATVHDLQRGVSDDQLVGAIRAADKAGLDCPLGWPAKFVSFLVAQQAGHLEPPTAHAEGSSWRRELAYRVTDQVVRAEAGLNPLSVSADRIAYAAFRCAALLARLADQGEPVDRGGGGVVIEVYPAAALRQWGLTHRGYKTPGRGVGLGFLVDELASAAPWLNLGSFEQLCRTSHDAFDAVVCAMAARAAALGHIILPDAGQREAALTEGWIALPTCSLDDLIHPAVP